jgi:uncharacterized repeat protein (TIGR01451 family)
MCCVQNFTARLVRLWRICRDIVLAALAAVICLAVPAHGQVINQYSNATTGTISDVSCNTAAQITRTFTVPTSYIVGDVDLGVFLSHTYRSDLRITLRSPLGTTVTVMTWTGNVQSGDNLNDLFDDEAAAAIITHNATATDPLTPVPPPYSHSFRPSNPLSAFDGQNAAGTWTLVVCDAVAADTGTFRRADLYINQASLSASKSSTVISNPASLPGGPFAVPGATVRYCILLTNNSLAGAVNANTVQFTDSLPAGTTFVPNSMLSGSTCSTAATAEDDDAVGPDDTDLFSMSYASGTVTGTTASLAPGATVAMVFLATVN